MSTKLVLVTTYIEREQDTELREIASEMQHLGISRSEILRVCLSLGLDSLRALVPDVLRDGGGAKMLPPPSLSND